MARFTRNDSFKFEVITPKVDVPKQFHSLGKASERLSSWSESAIHDWMVLSAFFVWIIPLLLVVIFVVLSFSKLPITIPLFYSRPWGDLQIARNQFIFLPVVSAFLIGVVNFALAVTLHQRDKVASYILAGIATLASLLAVITTYNIVGVMR